MSHVFLPMEYLFCSFHSENDYHLFIDCPFSQDVIGIMAEVENIPPLPWKMEGHSFAEYVCELKYHLNEKNISFYVTIWWFIQYSWNNITFHEEPFTPGKLGAMIRAYLKNITYFHADSITKGVLPKAGLVSLG